MTWQTYCYAPVVHTFVYVHFQPPRSILIQQIRIHARNILFHYHARNLGFRSLAVAIHQREYLYTDGNISRWQLLLPMLPYIRGNIYTQTTTSVSGNFCLTTDVAIYQREYLYTNGNISKWQLLLPMLPYIRGNIYTQMATSVSGNFCCRCCHTSEGIFIHRWQHQ